ncbi:30761_t:CDS:2 [Gigaspora margarita]|uniref:RNA-dependent RNA polymerase n=1 Tax=Gigaspora margarita TaxID=4874 RepID=A0ABM8VZK9_GIGMA|nr:30761_t:CDS:2 [Gigaspora margarita]
MSTRSRRGYNDNNDNYPNPYNNQRRYSGRNNKYLAGPPYVPSTYRSQPELKFRVTNVPYKATTAELKEYFSSYGSVHELYIDIDFDRDGIERPTGIIFLTFRPPPQHPFWNNAVRFHGRELRFEYKPYNNKFLDYSDGQHKIREDCIYAESVEMGAFIQPNVFIPEAKFTEKVKFALDYKWHTITIQFGFQGIHIFKLEIDFNHIDGEVMVEFDGFNNQCTKAHLTVASKFPAKYWTFKNNAQSASKFSWRHDECWMRRTEIRVISRSLEEQALPLQLNMPNNSDQISRWLVFRVTFDFNDTNTDYIDFEQILRRACEYNILSKLGVGDPHLHINVEPVNSLSKITDRSMLPFDALYAIESNISHNFLNEYNLSEEFYRILEHQPHNVAIHIMNKIFSDKKRIYDPLLFLKHEILELKDIKIKSDLVPHYCVLMRKVVVTPTTMYMLPPVMETSNRVIRHFKNYKNNFLRVQFTDEASEKVSSSSGSANLALYNRIFRVLINGIKIGDLHYEFLAFSASQLRDHSCWFFASIPGVISASTIREWMGDFSNIKNVAKYAARMGHCFSSTRAVSNLPVDDITEIPDIIRNGYVFSDGIGKISPKLAKTVAEILEFKYVPSAFQFRLGGYKGVLCQSRYLRNNQIQVRPSQNKFESKHNIIEVIKGSRMITAYLNRQAITLLSTLGVPDEVFIRMQKQQVEELDRMLKNEEMAIRVLNSNIDEHDFTRMMSDLVKAKFFQRNDPYIVNLISLFRITMLRNLKKKAKIRVDDGAFLLGVLDETETLREDQIYCCISDPNNPGARRVITGNCVIFRNPCFHPGDVRVVNAVNCKSLDYLVDVVVFPATGYRDIPSQLSGGDLDGDDFTIIHDPNLIPKITNVEPMDYNAPQPILVDHVTIDHIKKFFVNYILSDNLGLISNAHLAKADLAENGAFHGTCLRLAQLNCEAVDFPKTGIPAIFPNELKARDVPDFMEKFDKATYRSEKVLGKLYRSIKVSDFNPYTKIIFDERLIVPGFELYIDGARIYKKEYDSELRSLMNQYGLESEYEAVSGFIVSNTLLVGKKKPRETQNSVTSMVAAIKSRYKEIFEREFYSEGKKVVLPEAYNLMKAKASAWYYVTYHHSELKEDDPMMSFPWINYEILCNIAIKNNSKMNKDLNNQGISSSNNSPVISSTSSFREEPVQYQHVFEYRPHVLDELDNEDDGLGRLQRLIAQQSLQQTDSY